MSLPPLADQVRADLFTHLAAMEKAGLPPDKSFSLLRLPGNLQARVVALRKLLGRGVDIPTAGSQSGLFSELETNLLHAAFNAGSPELTYKRMATRYAHKARQASLIKSRMAMPLVVLFIALAVQPLPALVAGTLTASGYLLSIMRPFVLLAGGVFVYKFIATRLFNMTAKPTPIQVGLSTLLTRIPLFGPMLVRRNVRDFYENLALMLEAGLPMLDALPKAVNTVSLCVIRADFSRLQSMMAQGMTLAQAVGNLHYQGKYPVQSFAQTGEGSGSLPEMLLRFADGESEAVAQFQVQVAEWLPRLLYGMVMLWMAYQLLHQHII
ncbi:type II secretion system F family protein [Solimicrobium silvestre]|uniref:Type II secretion system (T2SS), protein F n=1 Tax=Solimicrobium silvestre TaxID=2099400 RepID=A0A2S9H3V7_9BURK|nr:type II secretion system F family protein [Solimicrobium silvestre]PRC94613.1 Type II secretion system (T2SS), protein F [Solimicrobium silvestre]